MCKVCGKYRCPPSCPNYEGFSPERGKPICVCCHCERNIYELDDLWFFCGQPFCADCKRELRRLIGESGQHHTFF